MRLRNFLPVLALTALTSLAQPQKPSDLKLLPVPTAAQQASAEKVIKDVFKAQYAKHSTEDRIELAKQMMKQVKESGNDSSSCYVLLREARDLFAAAGDIDDAINAADEILAQFQADPVETKLPMLTAAARTAKDQGLIAEQALTVALDTSKRQKFSEALKAMTLAKGSAAKSSDRSLQSRVKAAAADIERFQQESKESSAAQLKLADTPDDPAANLAVGSYRCFRLDQYEDGLPLLLKGSSSELAAIAKRELAHPADAATMAAAGDAWWDYAQSTTTPSHKRPSELRACSWYERAVPELTGLKKATAEKRLTSVAPIDGPSSAELDAFAKKTIAKFGLPPAIDWSKYTDRIVESDGVTYASGVLRFTSENGRLTMHRSPPQEGSMTFAIFLEHNFRPTSHIASNEHSLGGLPSFQIQLDEKRLLAINVCCGWTGLLSKTPIPLNRWTFVTVAWGTKGSAIVVNDKIDSQKNRCTPEGGPEEYLGLGKIYGAQANDSLTGARLRFNGLSLPATILQKLKPVSPP